MAVPQGFFNITYEPPENIVTYPDETEEAACERIMEHTLVSVGVPCLCVRAEANALRLTTVIAPRSGARRLLSVHAEGDTLADTIWLVWSDGSAETLEESAMMKQG